MMFFKILIFLFKINIFMLLDCFDVLILQIIFVKKFILNIYK